MAACAGLAACDTGDGKTLTPYDPDDYPSQTVATSAPPAPDDGGDDAGGGFVVPTVEPFGVYAPWMPGGTIDARNTCDGANVAPAVSWGGAPDGTVEIALALVDDSVVDDGQPFVHWAISGLDPLEVAIVEGDVPEMAFQATNFFGNVGYDGPCPPVGDDPHMYRLTASALRASPEVTDAMPATEFLEAVARVTIGTADLTATYGR